MLTYIYDTVGNWTAKNASGEKTGYTYNSRNQLITEDSAAGTVIYRYDANGNLLNKAGTGTAVTYTYDLYNRLLQYKEGSRTESYTYDAEGVRRSKKNGTEDILFVSDTSGSLSQTLAETDAEGNLTAAYIRADTLLGQTRGGETSYYLYDGHGDVRALLNEAGKITDKYRYNAYGELLEQTGDTENHYLYTGEYYDGTPGLYYLRARYMDPSAGTFISMDTYEGSIYDPDTLHKYLYANGNPVTYNDPSGNFFSAVGAFAATTISTVYNNFYTLNVMGIISGVTNSAITAFLGGSDMEISMAFVKGYLTGFGIGALLYVTAAYSVVAYARMLCLLSSSSLSFNLVMTVASVTNGNKKETLVYGTLTILSIFSIAQVYEFNCEVNVIGNKGSAKIGFDNSNPNNPKLNGESIKSGTPNEVGKIGENYVSKDLNLSHNNETINIDGRNRIPDFYDKEYNVIAESKNVASLSYTKQLRDYVKLAQERGTVLILYTREDTYISGPLQKAIDAGLIEHRVFPW